MSREVRDGSSDTEWRNLLRNVEDRMRDSCIYLKIYDGEKAFEEKMAASFSKVKENVRTQILKIQKFPSKIDKTNPHMHTLE